MPCVVIGMYVVKNKVWCGGVANVVRLNVPSTQYDAVVYVMVWWNVPSKHFVVVYGLLALAQKSTKRSCFSFVW